MEDAASEFVVQGLELDYALVSWDGDLRLQGGGDGRAPQWSYHDFRGIAGRVS